mmetsp:Transcript_34006/g.63490  ORF Transcript_34006/g.63490 Transcript_34006/m.63490 type:complete len:143 (+) Transcript_34006:35-463(+)
MLRASSSASASAGAKEQAPAAPRAAASPKAPASKAQVPAAPKALVAAPQVSTAAVLAAPKATVAPQAASPWRVRGVRGTGNRTANKRPWEQASASWHSGSSSWPQAAWTADRQADQDAADRADSHHPDQSRVLRRLRRGRQW